MTGSIDYADLLGTLNSPRFRSLRPSQAAVLSAYAGLHTSTADLAIELPTGAGKSLIALLIGEAWRREGRPVAVLTGNKTLARQMESEGNALGVPVERFEGSGPSIPLSSRRRYRRAEAIGIMNYWVMFNQNPVVDAAELLVIDDAHLAESALDSLYSVEIDTYSHPILFQTLMQTFAHELPDYAVFRDAALGVPPRSGADLVSFLDQSLLADRIQGIIDNSAEIRTSDDLRFRWGRLRGRMREANLYADSRSICIRPYVYPLRENIQYQTPAQRIYMSATVGDPSDLARRLGTLPIEKVAVEQDDPAQTTTLGRRLILLNPDEKTAIPARLGSVILAALKIQPKSVWLCNSKLDAASYKAVIMPWLEQAGFQGHPSWILTSLGNEIDQFKAAPAGHLFVGGRFDGMDFHQDECRLVVLTAMPRAINLQESFAADYLRDAGFMIQRVNQRVVQALGRCNRAADDFGVYLLADPRFTASYSQEHRRRGLPASILAELDLAENQTEIPTPELVTYVQRFLAGDFSAFDADLADARGGLRSPRSLQQPPPPDDATGEIAGWLDLYERQNYTSAESHFRTRQQTLNSVQLKELGAFAQWCEAKAAFLEGRRGDNPAAQRALALLDEAIARGGASSWFNRLRSSVNRHRQAGASLLAPTYPDDFSSTALQSFDALLERIGPRRLPKWTSKLDENLRSGKHDQFTVGLEELGTILGYEGSRPRYGAATDCRWRGVFGNQREVFTWEAKIEHGIDALVDAHAVGQAHIQHTRAAAEFTAKGYVVRGLIVTHLDRIDSSAASSMGTLRVLRKDAILALWARTRVLLDAYAQLWSADSLDARVAAASQTAPKLPPTGWLDRAAVSDELFIDDSKLLSEWPRPQA